MHAHAVSSHTFLKSITQLVLFFACMHAVIISHSSLLLLLFIKTKYLGSDNRMHAVLKHRAILKAIKLGPKVAQ